MPNTKFKPILLLSILFFLLIFLSAFDDEPASPSPRLPTPTSTSIYAIPSWQPQEVEPLTITTPDAPVDQYKLADWNAKTAQLALSNPGIHEEEEIYHPNAYFTLLEESYLRFQSLTNDESFLIELAEARNYYYFSFSRATSDAFPTLPMYSKLLEKSLNQGDFKPENAAQWIYGNMAVNHIESIQTSNLFGNGRLVWIFHIIKSEKNDGFILIVAQNEDGTFSVSTLSTSNWQNNEIESSELFARDLNGNGMPEIILERQYWHQRAYKNIAIYEWNGQQFTSLLRNTSTVHYFSTDYEENQNAWTFENHQDGTSTIIGKQTTLTAKNCPDYIETYYYIWTGRSFELEYIDVNPFPEDTSSVCKVKWALTATQNEPQSIQAVTEALDDWPNSLDNEFGPASQDYFRLWLAETHALHGDSDTALQMLDDLITNPQNPLYSGIPEMAEVYKNNYLKGGPYLACNMLEEWKENERDHQWGVYVAKFQSGKSCEFYSNFPTLLEQQTFTSRNQLTSWLDHNRIQWNGLQEMDMNQDGLKDWLVITQTNYGRNELWALIQTEGVTLSTLVANAPGGAYTPYILQTSCNQYFPENGSIPVQICQMGSRAVAFQIINQGNRAYHYIQFEIGELSTKSSSVHGVELDNKTVTLLFDDYQIQYQWHDQHQRFELLQSTADESESPSLEELFFVDQNYQAVINELETWFAAIDPNAYDSSDSYLVKYTLPYRTYLLGLAYELNGDEHNAAQTYYNLWQTYPESPFTVIARHKLEKK
jgi:hypothetical protein